MTSLRPALVLRLARKELRETLRDRRTIITLVLMPVLLYPILGMAFNYFLLTVTPPSEVAQYRLAVRSREEVELFASFLELRQGDPNFDWVISDDVREMVRSGAADVAVEMKGTGRDPMVPDPHLQFECRVLRLKASMRGLKAEEFISDRLNAANIKLLRMRLGARARIANPVLPVLTEIEEVDAAEAEKASYLSALVPLILVLMTITGAVYPAIDLTAGERERGTLQILMAAPVSRVALLLAKYTAVMTVAILTAVVNLTMMSVTLAVTGLGATLFPGGVSAGTIVAVLALLLLFAAFFSAVLLAITSFARSFKEAQSYLIPVMLVALSPGMLSLMPGLKLGGLLTIAPLINVVLLARELLEGGVAPATGVMVVLSTLLYAFAAIAIAARLFGAEAVLYSEHGHFADLFRRPKQPRAVAPFNAALMCLALTFPLSFLFNGFIAQATALSLDEKLVLLAFLLAALFLGLPAASAYLSRVEWRSGFALNMPRPLALTGALLLGVSLWPLILELIALQEWIGFGTMPAAVREASKTAVQAWRESPVLVIFAMAVVPGIVEELFFRGYLFSALTNVARPWVAILVTGLAFGGFHLFPGGIFAIEKLLPTTVMGVALGWVRWRGGSVWPGMLLHVAHNSIVLSVALFPDIFGTDFAEGTHVPPLWLGSAAVAVPVAAALVWWSGKREE